MERNRDPITVGWREWLTLPDLGIAHIKAKIDTGARTSALHAFMVEGFHSGTRKRVRFGVHPLQRRTEAVFAEADVVDERWVIDSGGHREWRMVVRTRLQLGAHAPWPIELTLTDRETMRFRMLLGRTAMGGHVVVKPNSSFLLGRPHRVPHEVRTQA